MLYFLKIKTFKKVWSRLEEFFSEEFPFIAALPALIWQAFFSIVPLVAMFIYSIVGTEQTSNFLGIFTFDFYLELINYTYLKAIYNAMALAIGTIIAGLLFCFTAAYIITFYVRRKYQPLCVILMMLPLWTNFIVRIYSWFFLLDRRGILSLSLAKLGIIERSTQFLFNPLVTIVGMVYSYYPFMLLPLYMAMSSIRDEYLEASADLGANGLQTLRFLIIPYCLSDIIFCAGLIGLMAFGEFAIPQLLGGSKYSFWGSIIVSKFISQRNFKAGAAYTFLGVAAVTIFCATVYLLLQLIKFADSQRHRLIRYFLTKE
jgi:spermidine/putrescine transport system permease protein